MRVTIWWDAVETVRLAGVIKQLTTRQEVSGTVVVQGRLFWSLQTDDGELVTIPRNTIVRTERHEDE